MSVAHKVVLFGMGHRYKHSLDALPEILAINSSKAYDIDFSAIFDSKIVSLTDIYKQVRRKYYPEKDLYCKFIKK